MSAFTSTNIRHTFFILAGAVALVLTWPHAFRWMAAGGNILNPVEFFGDAIAAWRHRRVPQHRHGYRLARVHGVGRLRQQADWTGV